MAGSIIKQATDDIGFKARHIMMFMGGKQSAISIGEAISGGAAALSGPALLATMGLGAAMSAALTQMDYRHKINTLKYDYCEELSAKCHKPQAALLESDLDVLAKGDKNKAIVPNHTIDEELAKARRQRNWGILFCVAATLTSLAVVLTVVTTVPAVVTGLLGPQLAAFVVKGIAGVLTYNAIKQPLYMLGNKLFNLNQETTHDRIMAMKQDHDIGKHISREQVLSVFASANPQLDSMIVSEYGNHFDKLDLTSKRQAGEDISKFLPLDKLVADINHGKINATELAFAAEGQISGVEHKPAIITEKKPGRLGVIMEKLRYVMHRHPHAAVAVAQTSSPTHQETAAIAVAHAETGGPSYSYVKQLGLTQTDSTLSHVKRQEQRSLAEITEMTGPH